MSLLYESKECYPNEIHYRENQETFELTQARQAQAFVDELIKTNWLKPVDDAVPESKAPADLVKRKADKLLRHTKIKALLRARSVA